MPPKKRGPVGGDQGPVPDHVQMAIHVSVKRFLESDEDEMEFPSSFTSAERAYAHKLVRGYGGLASKSYGVYPTRVLVVSKLTEDSRTHHHQYQSHNQLTLLPLSRSSMASALSRFPLTTREMDPDGRDTTALRPPDVAGGAPSSSSSSRTLRRSMGKLNAGVLQVPPGGGVVERSPLFEVRKALPVWPHRRAILDAVAAHQVILVTGETGSGKTSQVPQFILEDAASGGRPCRIVCAEPRRLAAVSMAERVAAERDEKVGQSVGFQIRLESRVSPRTLLTFCTNGILLRTLMGGEGHLRSTLSSMTHVIIDEVHERDKNSDFLLIVLRNALASFPDLKLILMSATVNVDLFQRYFEGLHHIRIPGKQFPVEELFLEDVLLTIGFPDGVVLNKEPVLVDCQVGGSGGAAAAASGSRRCGGEDDVVFEVDQEIQEAVDDLLSDAFRKGTFDDLMAALRSSRVPIDLKHSKTGVTALMCAAGRGRCDLLEELLLNGANPFLKADNNWTALDFAQQMNRPEAELLLRAGWERGSASKDPEAEAKEAVLGLYKRARIYGDDLMFIDKNLICELVDHIVTSGKNRILSSSGQTGSILVFLPGYDEILNTREALELELVERGFLLYIVMLHSQVVTFDRSSIFRQAPPGYTKVILSTNVAETSLTIDDVTHVIDSGKVKEKSFDCLAGTSMLRVEWISKASAAQRRGRAGRVRPGTCYRLYSSTRAAHMALEPTPEILRSPLTDLCLSAKVLAPVGSSLVEFFAQALEPPSIVATRAAVQALQHIEALDAFEEVTELGSHLLDLPIEPHLGKMVLYSVVLKCLDPVLTIACCCSYKDPFLISGERGQQGSSKQARRRFAADSQSDHMVLLRAFQGWQRARSDGCEKKFCLYNQVSSSAMEMVMGMRTQLLGQLRASGFVRAKGPSDIRDLNQNSENWAVVKAALISGCYPRLARVDRISGKLKTLKQPKVGLSPSSVVVNNTYRRTGCFETLKTDWLIFDEMARLGSLSVISGATAVSPVTVALFAGPSRLPDDALRSLSGEVDKGSDSEQDGDPGGPDHRRGSEVGSKSLFKIDQLTSFVVDEDLARLLLDFRLKFASVVLKRLEAAHSGGKVGSQAEEALVQAVVRVLSAEELEIGLTQPAGVGQRPKALSSEPYLSESVVRRTEAASSSKPFGRPQPPAQRTQQHRLPDILSNSSRKYFIVKATTIQAVNASVTHNLWQFGNQTEQKLLRTIRDGNVAIVIFSVMGSCHFQGFARFTGRATPMKVPELRNQGMNSGSGIQYLVEWVKRADMPFRIVRHLFSSPCQRDHQPGDFLQSSRDGQEVEASVGEALCRLWDGA